MKARLLIDAETTDGFKVAGTEIEHPDALHLVAMGVAEPADDATSREWTAAQQATADGQANRVKRVALDRPKLAVVKPLTT